MSATGTPPRHVLRVLFVEDDQYDADLLIELLHASGYDVQGERVQTADALRASLARQDWDLVLSDYSLPMFDAPAALAIVRQRDAHLPFIIVSGTIGEDMAIRALKSGADDFVIKGNFARLVPAIERELREVEMRRSMRQMEARAAYALAAAGVGIWEYDFFRGELQWSQDVSTMFGLPTSLSRGALNVFKPRVHPDDWPLVETALRESAELGLSYRTDFRVMLEDGTIRWVHAKGRVGRSTTGDPTSMLGIVMDVTDRKELEEQLRQSQKLDSVGRLAGGIAHDFNNILTAILGYTEMTLDQIGPDKPISSDLREIRTASERAVALVRQLLAFSRKQTLHPVAVDVNEVVTSMRDMLERLIGEEIEISAQLGTSIPPMLADRAQLEQVLMNLAVNARDAMPHGGVITISTASASAQDVAAITRRPAPAAGYIELQVSDVGTGMDSATQAQIFEPFFTTKGVGKGTGLGLSTVYGVVQQLKGHITVSSRQGVGTTFTLYFPQVDGASALPAPSRTVKPGLTLADRRHVVLVVEDQRGVRHLVSRILSRHGYKVLAADGATEARALFNEHGPTIDLLITDVVMPNTRGPELAAELCARNGNLRVLFMSGYAGDDIEVRGELMSGLTVLEKPFSASVLLQAAHDVLATRM